MPENVFYFQWEPALMEWMQNYMGKIAVGIASVVTLFGEQTLLVLILGYLYWCYDKKFAKEIGTGIVVALIAPPLLKNLVFRTRPYFNHKNIKCLKPVNASADLYNIQAQGYSFPSGHSTNAATVYGAMAVYKKTKLLWTIAIVLTLLVGISRVALGAHYPTDVLAGWGLGFAIAFSVHWLQGKVKNKNLLHLCIFICVLPGCFYCRTEDYFAALGAMAGFFLSIPFEEKYVNFEETRSVMRSVVRIAGGILLYVILNKVLKLPFSESFLHSNLWTAHLVCVLRYGIILFGIVGVYPLCFNRWNKKGKE